MLPPAQLRRSEKRRKDFLEQTVDKCSQNEAEKSALVKDVIRSDKTYNAKIKASEHAEALKRTWTIEGEFHAPFPQKKFKNYLEVTFATGVETSEDYG